MIACHGLLVDLYARRFALLEDLEFNEGSMPVEILLCLEYEVDGFFRGERPP